MRGLASKIEHLDGVYAAEFFVTGGWCSMPRRGQLRKGYEDAYHDGPLDAPDVVPGGPIVVVGCEGCTPWISVLSTNVR